MTEKQKIFADEYLIDLNATRAYRVAYPSVKKDAAAAVNGSKLLRNTNVSEYIKEMLEKMNSERVADVQEVMEYLTSVMRREKKECVVVTISRERSTYVKDDNGTPRKQTIKEEIPQIVEIPAKLSDANKAAELLGKRFSLFSGDKDTDKPIQITFVKASDSHDDG
ncbi:MAG: terminase small subunit [Clostridia bacterium]|nr:terminase small subunit [Clostridia bacterium]